MNQKELTKTFMLVAGKKNLWSPWILQKELSALMRPRYYAVARIK